MADSLVIDALKDAYRFITQPRRMTRTEAIYSTSGYNSLTAKIRSAMEAPEAYKGHFSDCAVYNEPSYRNGPCDCGGPIWAVDFEPIETLPRDDTILIAVEAAAHPEREPTVYAAYVDEHGVLCDSGTWMPEKGFASDHFRTVGWKRLPRFSKAA